jgi:hypothetical protein
VIGEHSLQWNGMPTWPSCVILLYHTRRGKSQGRLPKRRKESPAKCHCSHILLAGAYENDQPASGSIPDESPSHAALLRAARILGPSCLHTRVAKVSVAVERLLP